MELVGLFVWKDVVELGYLPLECFKSVYPIVDKAIISVDPSSGNGTLDLVDAICAKYPNVKRVETHWKIDSPNGEAIGNAYNDALSHVSIGDWVLEVKADELLPTALMRHIGENWRVWAEDYNIVSFYFLHTIYNAQLVQPDSGYTMSRKLGLQDGTLRFVADAWKFDVAQPRMLICPFSETVPVIHLHHFFKEHFIYQLKGSFRMFSEGWTQERMDNVMARMESIKNDPMWDSITSPFGEFLPYYVKQHLSRPRYEVLWT